jgi:autotransporter-associated beta strand protein
MNTGRSTKSRSHSKRFFRRKSPSSSNFIVATGISILLSGRQPIHAATYTWDANTSKTGAQDGTGSWGTATANWWNGTSDQVWNNSADNTAVFGASGTAGTVTLITGITVGGITFNSGVIGNYTIAGNTITLGAETNTFNILQNGTIASVITGGEGNGFVESGSGTLILTASNTYTGGTTINSGTLQLGDGGTNNGSVVGNIIDNAALVPCNI